MQSQMPLVAAREFNAPIEPAALGQPARSEGMRLRPRSSPSREGSSYSGSRAVQWQHRTRGALPNRVLPLNNAFESGRAKRGARAQRERYEPMTVTLPRVARVVNLIGFSAFGATAFLFLCQRRGVWWASFVSWTLYS